MRKALLITGLLAAFSFTAAAENIVTIQGSYQNLGRGITSGSGDTKVTGSAALSTWGGTVTGFFEVGGNVGVLAGAGVYFPTYVESESKWGSQKRSADYEVDEGGLAVAGEFGVGWNLTGPDVPVGVILGGGLHLNYYQLEESVEYDETSSSVLGVGFQALPYYAFSDAVYGVAAIKLAFDFVALSYDPDLADNTDHKGSTHLSFGLGVGFRL